MSDTSTIDAMTAAAETQAQQMGDIDAAMASAAAAEITGDPQTTGSTSPRDYEAEAHVQGWRPQDEYTGSKHPWVDAKTFIERGERFRDKQAATIESLQAKIAAFDGTAAQMRKFMEAQLAKKDEEHKLNMQELRLQIKAATREGDDSRALSLEDELAARQATHEAEKQEVRAANPPAANTAAMQVYNDWVADGNDWVNTDKVLGDHAFETGKQLKARGNALTGRAFLELVKAKVEEDFPRRFAQATAAKTSRTATTAGGGKSSAGQNSVNEYNGKTINDLPAEDLKIMKDLIKGGFYKSPADYLKAYFS